jgi:hypothetical protein
MQSNHPWCRTRRRQTIVEEIAHQHVRGTVTRCLRLDSELATPNDRIAFVRKRRCTREVAREQRERDARYRAKLNVHAVQHPACVMTADSQHAAFVGPPHSSADATREPMCVALPRCHASTHARGYEKYNDMIRLACTGCARPS